MLFLKREIPCSFPTRNNMIENEILMSGTVLEIKLIKIQNGLKLYIGL